MAQGRKPPLASWRYYRGLGTTRRPCLAGIYIRGRPVSSAAVPGRKFKEARLPLDGLRTDVSPAPGQSTNEPWPISNQMPGPRRPINSCIALDDYLWISNSSFPHTSVLAPPSLATGGRDMAPHFVVFTGTRRFAACHWRIAHCANTFPLARSLATDVDEHVWP